MMQKCKKVTKCVKGPSRISCTVKSKLYARALDFTCNNYAQVQPFRLVTHLMFFGWVLGF